MATSGKKGKKKTKAISLQHFLSNGDSPSSGLAQVAKKVRNPIDSDDDENVTPLLVYQLPTAPRANRIYEDDDSVPNKPPYLAYITNLPFDIKDDDIYEFFSDYKIESVRLPREDGEGGRLRGFGYIQFETREDLIKSLSLPDPQIKNRRIRINISNENDQQRDKRGMNRSRYEGFGSSENKDTNWRKGGDVDRDNRDKDNRRSGHNYGRGNRDRDHYRERDGSAEAGSWRTGDRSHIESSTSPAKRGDGGGYGERFSSGRRQKPQEDEKPRERPKLVLQPRTLPLPEIVIKQEEKDPEAESEKSERETETDTPEPPKPKPVGVSAEKVFGDAKPVDTAAREKEIEERIEKKRLEKLKREEEEEQKEKEQDEKEVGVDEKFEEKHLEKDEKDTKNATSWRKRSDDDVKRNYDQHRKYSPDRRGGGLLSRRNDDRRGSNRDNRDRRDYRDNRGGFDRGNRNIDSRDRDRYDRNDRENYNRGSVGGGGNRGDRGDRTDRDRDRGYSKDNKSSMRGSGGDLRDHRNNRDGNRQEKQMPKYQPPQEGPVLSTSNKYAVFLDEDDASE